MSPWKLNELSEFNDHYEHNATLLNKMFKFTYTFSIQGLEQTTVYVKHSMFEVNWRISITWPSLNM